jgi:cytochrome P450
MAEPIDLNDPVFLKNRRESYQDLRANNPFAETELNGEKSLVLTRFRDIDAVLRNRSAQVQPGPGEYPAHIGDGPAALFYRLSLPSMDGAEHARLRRLLTPPFSPQSVAKMETWVGEIIESRIGAIEQNSVFDVVAELGDTIPVDVACRLLHIPREDASSLVSGVNDINLVLSQADLGPAELARSDSAAQAFFDYFSRHLDSHRTLPQEDLVGALSHAEQAGEVSRDLAIITLIDILIASYHTTMVSFSNAIHALARYPEQRAALIADPSLATRAWEELLRFDSPVHFRHRYVSEPVTIGDYRIDPRVKIMLGLASANWDDTVFENANAFDLARPNVRHMTFGGGGHFCVGAQVSRLEGRIFLPRFLAKFPDFALVEKEPPRYPNLTFPFLERLTIEVGARHSS